MKLIENGLVDGKLQYRQSDRRIVKEILIYRWIYEFRFIDVGMVSLLLNISVRVAYRFLNQLEIGGFIKSKKVVLRARAERLFYMSVNGYHQWLKLDDDISDIEGLSYVNRAKSVTSSLVNHNLLTQYACLRTTYFRAKIKLFEYEFFSEKNVKKGIPTANLEGRVLLREPDALIAFINARGMRISLAVEVELVQKSKARIYWILKKHLDAISEGFYQTVYFYFDNPRLLDLYKKYFSEQMWPVSVESNNNYFIPANPMFVDVSGFSRIDARFIFSLISKETLNKDLNH